MPGPRGNRQLAAAVVGALASILTCFTLAADRGAITVDRTNPAWLVHEDGSPVFICGPGDPEGFLFRGRRLPDGTRDGDQLQLIESLAATGANSIYLMAIRSHGGDGDGQENPFLRPDDPRSALNLKILDQWEIWFREMDRRGIVVYFFLYDDGADPFRRSAGLWSRLVSWFRKPIEEAEREFVRTIVDRFKHHRHLIWVVAEEYAEALSPDRVAELAALIREVDPVHPIAVHQLPGLVFDFGDDPNIDQFALQYGDDGSSSSELHDALVEAWREAGGRYNLNMSEVPYGGLGTDESTRRKIWAMAMGGAYVMVNGWDIQGTPTARLEECGYLAQLMRAAGVNRLAPHDELAAGGTEYVLADPGSSYVLYASNLEGRLGLRDLPAGSYELRWLDAITGLTVDQRADLDSGDHGWSKPEGIGTELALALRRTVPPESAAVD